MVPDAAIAKLKERFSGLQLMEPAPVKGHLSVKLSGPSKLIGVIKMLKDELGYEFLDFITAVDWKGPVDLKGYIVNPNPNPFMPEGVRSQMISEPPTPGFPYREAIEVIYALSNWAAKSRIFVRVETTRGDPRVPSLIFLWKGADWQEREIFDLLGVVFEGHPNLKKILTPDFIKGHPLRKDYVHIKDKYD